MTRDQFLVETEGGCWHVIPDEITMEYRQTRYYRCEKCNKELAEDPDFSKWENMGRLLELTEMKGIYWIDERYIYPVGYRTSIFFGMECMRGSCKAISDIPDITATLIAQALGWEEKK
jgi:hypothetical protein